MLIRVHSAVLKQVGGEVWSDRGVEDSGESPSTQPNGYKRVGDRSCTVRFRSKEKPNGLLRPRDQRRLTMVIFAVGALALVLKYAGSTTLWTGLLGNPPQSADTGRQPAVSEALLGDSELHSDEITVVPTEGAGRRDLDLRSLLDKSEAARLDRAAQGLNVHQSAAGATPIPVNLLKTIRDDALGIQTVESDAYFASLRLAGQMAAAERKQAPDGRFALFMDSPETCRGRAWTLRGKLRRMNRVQDDANSFGLKTLYDAWISLPDSGNQLVHVVAIAADAGLPLKNSAGAAAPDIELTGYFFKREGYIRSGTDGLGDVGLAPLLVTGRIQRYQPPTAERNGAEALTPWLGWLSLVVVISVGLVVLQFRASDAVFRRTRGHQLTMLPVRVSFDGVHAVTVAESLQQLEVSSPGESC